MYLVYIQERLFHTLDLMDIASLGQDSVEFRCFVSIESGVLWAIDGRHLTAIGE